MIPRYTREEMGRVWNDANRFQIWLDVELAAADTLAEAGEVPKEAAAALRARAKVDVARINELEAKVKHDVIAFTMAVGESIGDPEAARWLHYGLAKSWMCARTNSSTPRRSVARTAFTPNPSLLA